VDAFVCDKDADGCEACLGDTREDIGGDEGSAEACDCWGRRGNAEKEGDGGGGDPADDGGAGEKDVEKESDGGGAGAKDDPPVEEYYFKRKIN